MKGNCADLHLGGVVKLPGLTASSWATRPLPRSRTGQGVTSPVTPTRAKHPPPPCKAGFGGRQTIPPPEQWPVTTARLSGRAGA
ncbi:hypothetical protein BBR18_004703 [Salmonella enterica subsp. enterica serovar 4,[5],12:b:-]|nr:hypothetical protein [Salmonella enterica subsp. enterica serovar 4,[5],12:b:-]